MSIKLKSLIMEGIKEKLAIEYISNLIKGSEFENHAFLAGGIVRDELMGLDPHDIDITVDLPEGGIRFAEWATKKMGNYKEQSNPIKFPTFGTAKFNLRGISYKGQDLSDIDIEVVQTRTEKYTAGSRKPETTYGSLEQDVNRRDLTINSLLKNLTTGEILDLTGKGVSDIKQGIVRTPIDPDLTFQDDPLRMLRLCRFAVKYNFEIPLSVIKSVKKNAHQLKNISQERIRDELDKILVTGNPDKGIKLLKITGLLDYVIPELRAAVKMTQNIHHHSDVFNHTLDVLKKTSPVLLNRLIALFHDIGKTVTRTVTPTGVHFYAHEDEGAKMVRDIMFRLKYPTELIDAVVLGVKSHMRLKHGGDDAVKLSDKTLRKFKIEMGDKLENLLDVIHADNVAHSEASSMPNQIENVKRRLDQLNVTVSKPKLPINGNDLMAMGIQPGPVFKKILSAVTEKWFEDPNVSREEAIHIAKSIMGSEKNP